MAKDSVDAVKVGRRLCQDEELRTIRVGSLVGHREQKRRVVLQVEVLVRKHPSIDALPALAIAFREVSGLDHEVFDHPVECGALVVQGLPCHLPNALDKKLNVI